MKPNTLITGSRFAELLQHGKETEQIIARNDASLLQHSTLELERYFDMPPAQLPRQNAFALALALLGYLVVFALNLLMLLHWLPAQQPLARALSFFLPSMLFLLTILSASYLISRGLTRGLSVFCWLQTLFSGSTLLLLVVALLAGESGRAMLLLVALAVVLLCRWLLNSQSFIVFVLWCRSQRIATLARAFRRK